MGYIGAVLGDIIGSVYEGEPCENPQDCELITDLVEFTDDTVMTLAIKHAIDKNLPFQDAMREVGRNHRYCGFGPMFERWVFSEDPKPYGSYGNGSAMRASYIGEALKSSSKEDVIRKATESALPTHNHPEGIKGAVVTAVCVWMAENGASKDEIYNYMLSEYPPELYLYSGRSLDELDKSFGWDTSCQGSVPVALRAFYEADNYEQTMRNVLRYDCDSDTLCNIAGGIAASFFGKTGFDDMAILETVLTPDLLKIVKEG